MVIGKDEETCDLPEFAHICNCEDSIKYWNWRARGFGGAPEDEFCIQLRRRESAGIAAG